MDYNKAALELHSKFPGKIAVQSLCECKDRDALSTTLVRRWEIRITVFFPARLWMAFMISFSLSASTLEVASSNT